jgi:hypothetical protein
VTYRNKGIVGYFAGFYLFVCVMLLVGIISGRPLAGKLLAVGGLVIVLAALIRLLRSGVSVTPSSVRVKGVLRTRVFPWSDVGGFSATPTRSPSGGVFVAVTLKDGRRIVSQSLTARSANSAFARATIQGLERAKASRSQ